MKVFSIQRSVHPYVVLVITELQKFQYGKISRAHVRQLITF